MNYTVITTIQAPTAASLQMIAAGARAGQPTLIVGDRKTPAVAWSEGTEVLSFAAQRESSFRLAKLLPDNHYARKNLGYLTAIARSARAIFDTDDDNSPSSGWRPRAESTAARACVATGWINAYRFFSRERIWPRGFPLERINEAAPSIAALECERELIAPVQQGLVDGAPDVDAIWRLVLGCDFRFRSAPSVYLSAGAWCPINSQNTWWFPRAFPLLYLPSFVGFRITDIWRGFIAQRCLWEWGLGIVFHAPDMVQYRNPHSLMADFAAEIPAYLHNPRFCATLERTPLSAAPDAGGDNLHRCYVALIEAGFIPAAELPLVEAWLKDFALVAGGCGQTNG